MDTEGNYWRTEVYGVEPLAGVEQIDESAVFSFLQTLPTVGSKIDWSAAPGVHTHRYFDDTDDLASAASGEVLRRVQPGSAFEHVGDGLSPFGVRCSGQNDEAVLAALLEIPEHHFFVDEDRRWLVVASMEGDLDALDDLGGGGEL